MPVRSSTREKIRKARRPRDAETPPGRRSRVGESDLERRDRDLSQDTAVYNCECGLVFDAPVNTSVGCPHCGRPQAW